MRRPIKKVIILHGLTGTPNGGWRPWLMQELNKKGIYATSLDLPETDKPVLGDWLRAINECIHRHKHDKLYFVCHSLGVAAFLRFLEQGEPDVQIAGAVLVSGPVRPRLANLLKYHVRPFVSPLMNFEVIRPLLPKAVVLHGGSDNIVPVAHGHELAAQLNCPLIELPHAGHFTGGEGYTELPLVLDLLTQVMTDPDRKAKRKRSE